MIVLLKAIYRFIAIPSKIPTPFFTATDNCLTFPVDAHRPQIVKTNLSKKNNAEGITIPDSKLHCRATIRKTAWHWCQTRYVDCWVIIEDPDMSPHSCSHPSFEKKKKKMHEINIGEKTAPSANGVRKLKASTSRRENHLFNMKPSQKSTPK